MPLQSRFLSQLDILSDKLLKLFKNRGGQIDKRLENILACMTEVREFENFGIVLISVDIEFHEIIIYPSLMQDDVDGGCECILKALYVFLVKIP